MPIADADRARLAISPDAVILVLEEAAHHNRRQAFDLGGNPARYFERRPRHVIGINRSRPNQRYPTAAYPTQWRSVAGAVTPMLSRSSTAMR